MSKVREKIKLTSYDELLKVEITDGLKEIDVDNMILAIIHLRCRMMKRWKN